MRRFALLLGGLAILAAQHVIAQEQVAPPSDLILSWRSNAYSPPGYQGRVAASTDSSVIFLAEVLTSGKPADLSRYEIRWFVNENLYESGMGLTSVVYKVPPYSPSAVDVRVQIIGAPFTATEASMSVPFANPSVVIESPRGTTLYGGENKYRAVPYGFNTLSAKDLVYTWLIDGNYPDGGGDPQELILDIDGTPSASMRVDLLVENPANGGEAARATIDLSPAVSQ